MAGGAPGGELDNLNQVSYDGCKAAFAAHPDFAVGVKIRLTAAIANNGARGFFGVDEKFISLPLLTLSPGESEKPAYDIARRVAAECNVPLMTHHAISSIALSQCPGAMRPGDIYTHMYHGEIIFVSWAVNIYFGTEILPFFPRLAVHDSRGAPSTSTSIFFRLTPQFPAAR